MQTYWIFYLYPEPVISMRITGASYWFSMGFEKILASPLNGYFLTRDESIA